MKCTACGGTSPRPHCPVCAEPVVVIDAMDAAREEREAELVRTP